MADIQAVLSALDVFSTSTDKASIERANSWLQDFQHSPEAWSTCNVLLQSPQAPLPSKIFAAQTFRTKVTYDLNQVDQKNLVALRDTLISTLQTFHAGPRTIIVQVSLAIAGLALQMPEWKDPTQSMIDTFGRNPLTVPALLEFLTLLPEEIASNSRIPVTDEEYRARSEVLLTQHGPKVLELLNLYSSASGVTTTVQEQVLTCLCSWIYAGEVDIKKFANSPLFNFSFEVLRGNDDLFDSAVDLVCQVIHETQETDDNMDIIERIVPLLIYLKGDLRTHYDDPEKIRGLARIFSEAGETYRGLMLQHIETFFPIVEAIAECSAYPDLDIVPITFPFWMRLAQILQKRSNVSPLFIEAFERLMSVIIQHLHFPAELTTMTGQEAENFRSFRHVMGDTLKDCCSVLGTNKCLSAALEIITQAINKGPEATWQEIEAPLFAMRSMGAEVDPADAIVVPKIMNMIPLLPQHPRVRYAALLIISRYTEWINSHPEYIQRLLQYIAAGFEDTDQEVCAAAGQALKYMCQDCRQHLTDVLPTLHTFLTTTGSRLAQDDRHQVYEAIAYVISAMPMERAAVSLKTFSQDILAQVHALSNVSLLTKQQVEEVGDALENLEVMLHVVQGYGDELPPACVDTCQEAWAVFDTFLVKHGANYDLAERTTRVIRRGIDLFGKSAGTVAISVLARMSLSFEATGYPSFLWISGKVIGRFGYERDLALSAAIKEFYEAATRKVSTLLQTKNPGELPDLLEDYIQMLNQLLTMRPDIFFLSSAFQFAFHATLAGLTVVQTDIIYVALDLFRDTLTHDALEPGQEDSQPENYQLFANAIREALRKDGAPLLLYCLSGLTGDFPEEAVPTIISIFRILVWIFPQELLIWLPSVLEQLPVSRVPVTAKTQLLNDVTTCINGRQYDKVKYAIHNFDRASRKARDRRRNGMNS